MSYQLEDVGQSLNDQLANIPKEDRWRYCIRLHPKYAKLGHDLYLAEDSMYVVISRDLEENVEVVPMTQKIADDIKHVLMTMRTCEMRDANSAIKKRMARDYYTRCIENIDKLAKKLDKGLDK